MGRVRLWIGSDDRPLSWDASSYPLTIWPGYRCRLLVHSAVLRAAEWWNRAARAAGYSGDLFWSSPIPIEPDVIVSSVCYPEPTFVPESHFSAPRCGMLSPTPAWRLDPAAETGRILGHTDIRVLDGFPSTIRGAEVAIEKRGTLSEVTEIAVHELGHVLGLDDDMRYPRGVMRPGAHGIRRPTQREVRAVLEREGLLGGEE